MCERTILKSFRRGAPHNEKMTFVVVFSLSLSLFLSLAPFLMWFSELHAIMKTARCPQTGIISHTFLRFYNFIHSTRCKCILKYRATFPQSECYTEKNVLIIPTNKFNENSILMRTNKISIYDKQKFCPFSLKYFFIGLFY